MELIICASATELSRRAAEKAAEILREAIAARGSATLVLATGTSQFAMLENLRTASGIAWPRVTGFHLDEYLGLGEDHPASFRRYLRERFVGRVELAAFHYLNGEADPEAECRRVGDLLARHPPDLTLLGVGENGHLAFNDPPADFEAAAPYLAVNLAESCRRQQVGEKWFATLEEVPRRALTMSIRQIMRSRAIVCTAPERRKARAVAACFGGPVRPEAPASILQTHPRAWVYMDAESAAELGGTKIGR